MCWRRRRKRRRSRGGDCVVLEEQGVGGGWKCRDDRIGQRSNDLSLFLFYSAVVAQLGSFFSLPDIWFKPVGLLGDSLHSLVCRCLCFVVFFFFPLQPR